MGNPVVNELIRQASIGSFRDGAIAINILENALGRKATDDELHRLIKTAINPQKILKDSALRSRVFQSLDSAIAKKIANAIDTQSECLGDPDYLFNDSEIYKISAACGLYINNKISAQLDPLEKEQNACLVEASYSIFEHQANIIKRLKSFIEGGGKRTLIHMPTGSGKTRTSMRYIGEVINNGAKILWITYQSELIIQAREEFKKMWKNLGSRTASINSITGTHEGEANEYLNADIIFASFTKLALMEEKLLDQMTKHITHIFIDEAHESLTPTRTKVINLMKRDYHWTYNYMAERPRQGEDGPTV